VPAPSGRPPHRLLEGHGSAPGITVLEPPCPELIERFGIGPVERRGPLHLRHGFAALSLAAAHPRQQPVRAGRRRREVQGQHERVGCRLEVALPEQAEREPLVRVGERGIVVDRTREAGSRLGETTLGQRLAPGTELRLRGGHVACKPRRPGTRRGPGVGTGSRARHACRAD